MINFSDVTSQLNMCQSMTLAFTRFYNRTKISAQFVMQYNESIQGLELSVGFTPRQPTEVEFSILFEELFDAEHLLLNKYIVNNAHNYDNIKQLFSKHKEEMNQIIEKQRKTQL